jgi:integrase
LQVDKTGAKFLFTLIIFFVLLIFIGIAPHCGYCCKGCSLSLVTTNIQQLFSDRVLRGEAILEISLEERLIANPASQKILAMFLVELRQRLRQEWYDNLTDVRELAVNTAERHFHVMHHMMRKASRIWATTTGIDRNPADQVEVEHIDDTRKRYLSEEELLRLKVALDERMYRKGTKDINKTNLRLRLLVLIAVSTGMRRGEVFRLEGKDILYGEGLIAVRARLKKGKIRLVPMPPELAAEIRRYPSVIGEERILPPEPGAKSGRQRADKSFP